MMKAIQVTLCCVLLLKSTTSFELVDSNHTSTTEDHHETIEDHHILTEEEVDEDFVMIDGIEDLGGLSLLDFLCAELNVSSVECTCENFPEVNVRPFLKKKLFLQNSKIFIHFRYMIKTRSVIP